MDTIFEHARQIRAGEQRNEIAYRLLEADYAACMARRVAFGVAGRLELCEIPVANREWIAADLVSVRARLVEAIEAVDKATALCPASAPVRLVEAAE